VSAPKGVAGRVLTACRPASRDERVSAAPGDA
jgi:hypothetical protein